MSAVLGAGGDETTWKALATLGVAFVCGSTALASLACLERGLVRWIAGAGVAVTATTFALWTEQIWAEHDSDRYWKALGLLGVSTFALLVVTALRLVAHHPRVLGRLYPATAASAVLAALAASVLILRENGDGWQLLAILVILTALGSLMTPVAQKLAAPVSVRPLRQVAVVGAVEVLAGSPAGDASLVVSAVRGRLRLRTDGRELELADGELLIVRSRP